MSEKKRKLSEEGENFGRVLGCKKLYMNNNTLTLEDICQFLGITYYDKDWIESKEIQDSKPTANDILIMIIKYNCCAYQLENGIWFFFDNRSEISLKFLFHTPTKYLFRIRDDSFKSFIKITDDFYCKIEWEQIKNLAFQDMMSNIRSNIDTKLDRITKCSVYKEPLYITDTSQSSGSIRDVYYMMKHLLDLMEFMNYKNVDNTAQKIIKIYINK
jgi:hypothetical protein